MTTDNVIEALEQHDRALIPDRETVAALSDAVKAHIANDEEWQRSILVRMNETPEKKSWHLGKEIPLALIAACILQTIGVIWWAASATAATSTRIEFLERTQAVAKDVQASIDRRQDEEAQRTENRLTLQFEKINAKLDRMMEAKR